MNKFEKILLTVLLIELFVGGGGRLIDFGILSIRQMLLVLLFLTYFYRIFKQKAYFNKDVNTFIKFTPVTIGVYLLLAWFFVSAIIGIANGHALSLVKTDLFRVAYVAAYFPLAYYISVSRFSINKIVSLLKYSALAVAIYTIIITLLGKTIFASNFSDYYYFLNSIMNDDLYFRPSNSVFYKSHFYVLVGLVISLNAVLSKKHTKIDIANIILCSISLIWSETRGFLLAFMLSVLLIIIIDTKILTDPIKGFAAKVKLMARSREFLKKAGMLVIIFIMVPILFQSMTLSRFEVEVVEEDPIVEEFKDDLDKAFEGKKPEVVVNDESVNARMDFIIASKDILLESPSNFIFGTGYGTEIDGRVNGIEMSFLDIFVEQGLIGLAIWCTLFLLVFINLLYVYKRENTLSTLDISLFSAFIGILLLTNINPFINNPIGSSFMLIVLIYSQNRKDYVKAKLS